MIVQITPDPVTAQPREAELVSLIFTREWEIEIQIDIFTKNKNNQRLFDVAASLPPGPQRDSAIQRNFPIRSKVYTTKGSRVNAQGEIDPEGVTTEMEFINNLTFNDFMELTGKNSTDSIMQAIRHFVSLKMIDIADRNQV